MNAADQPLRIARAVVARKLRLIARAQTELELLQAEFDDQLQQLKARYERPITSVEGRLQRMRAGLERYCRQNRRILIPHDRKSLETAFGQVGFHRLPHRVLVKDEMRPEEVCRRMRQAQLGEFIRITERPDRSGLRRAVMEGRITKDQLDPCGLQFVEGQDSFQCVPRPAWPECAAGRERTESPARTGGAV